MNIILWKKHGRLGNRLLTFSNLVALAIERDWTVYNLSFYEYSSGFYYFANNEIPQWPQPRLPNKLSRYIQNKIISPLCDRTLRSRTALMILRNQGYLFEAPDLEELSEDVFNSLFWERRRSWLVWSAWNLKFDQLRRDRRDELIEVFRPCLDIAQRVDHVFRRVPNNVLVVGLHVRRGDYKSWQGGRYYFSLDIYRSLLIRLFEILGFNNVFFLVASDQSIPSDLTEGLPAICLHGSEIEDLYVLARCDLIVGPPSSYAEWASFYGKGKRLVFDGTLPLNIDFVNKQ
jgi:hypothetical protein